MNMSKQAQNHSREQGGLRPVTMDADFQLGHPGQPMGSEAKPQELDEIVKQTYEVLEVLRPPEEGERELPAERVPAFVHVLHCVSERLWHMRSVFSRIPDDQCLALREAMRETEMAIWHAENRLFASRLKDDGPGTDEGDGRARKRWGDLKRILELMRQAYLAKGVREEHLHRFVPKYKTAEKRAAIARMLESAGADPREFYGLDRKHFYHAVEWAGVTNEERVALLRKALDERWTPQQMRAYIREQERLRREARRAQAQAQAQQQRQQEQGQVQQVEPQQRMDGQGLAVLEKASLSDADKVEEDSRQQQRQPSGDAKAYEPEVVAGLDGAAPSTPSLDGQTAAAVGATEAASPDDRYLLKAEYKKARAMVESIFDRMEEVLRSDDGSPEPLKEVMDLYWEIGHALGELFLAAEALYHERVRQSRERASQAFRLGEAKPLPS